MRDGAFNLLFSPCLLHLAPMDFKEKVVSEITDGIKVSVMTHYEGRFTNKEGNWYVFGYDIEIDNLSLGPIQILSRQWTIFDPKLGYRTVAGEGIVGEQPEILPGMGHRYQSGCQLGAPFGFMHGSFNAIRLNDGKPLSIKVPRFEFWCPWVLS
jgi:ApaG protein